MHHRNEAYVHDLKTESSSVRNKMITFMNRLISLGISGFRIAHARHISPADIQYIVSQLDTVNGNPPVVYHDVADFSEGSEFSPIRNSEYTPIGRIEEVRAGERLTNIFRGMNSWSLANLLDWNNDFEDPDENIIFVDDPYILRNVHHRERGAVASHRDRREYETIVALLLSLPYSGFIKILSSYTWPELIVGEEDLNAEMPPPLTAPNILPDGSGCNPGEYGLNCEHRWTALRNMFIFHGLDTIINTNISHFWNNGYQMAAFSRGGVAFVAINNEVNALQEKLQTGMVAGTYCDLMTGPIHDCTGSRTVTVDDEGFADIFIPAFDDNPMIVIREAIIDGD